MHNQNSAKTAAPVPMMRREDYKTVKHMDKATLSAYLYRVYMRGVERGRELEREANKPTPTTTE